MLLKEVEATTSPGIDGEYGEGYVRFALVENEERIVILCSLKIFL